MRGFESLTALITLKMEEYQNKKPKKRSYQVNLNAINLTITNYLLQQKKKGLIGIHLESRKIKILIKQETNNLEERLEEQETKEITLEQIALEEKNIINFPQELPYIKNRYQRSENYDSRSNTIDPSSGASIIYVSPSQLPSGQGWKVLSMYDPSTHTIYIANNLSPQTERFVYHHEVAHANGIRNESQADAYASSIVGYNIRNAA